MSDLQTSLVSKIRLDQSRVKPFKGFIFLCGGPTDVRSPLPVSLRDAVYRELAKKDEDLRRIRVAEHYKDWGHDSIYKDLVQFERHLAELSSLIVLILESSGAIAELGLFSAIDEFREKLLVFIDSNYYASDSFIRLGPIDFLEKTYENEAEVHRWYSNTPQGPRYDAALANQLQPDLADAVRSRLGRGTVEHQFDAAKWLHTTLLICDLVDLFAALTVREVRDLLVNLGVAWTEHAVKQSLYLLEKLGLLILEAKGTQRFYVTVAEQEYLRLHFIEDHFDTARFRSDVLSDYAQTDKKRFRAIQDARSRHA